MSALNNNVVYRQIRQLTSDLISCGLCVDQNYPNQKDLREGKTIIGIGNADHTICLKRISYRELYGVLLDRKQYNIKMLDGALITLLYQFQYGRLSTHRLSFFPAPDLTAYQNIPEIYSDDELYSENVDCRQIIAVPIRFDFDAGEACIPIEHPMSHLTLGQYEQCRIPVTTAVSPYQFLSFIVRNFYSTPKDKFHDKLSRYEDKFDNSIFNEEKNVMHICTPL